MTAAAEVVHLLGGGQAAPGDLVEFRQVLVDRRAGACLRQGQFGEAEDAHQQVVEIVGQAPREGRGVVDALAEACRPRVSRHRPG